MFNRILVIGATGLFIETGPLSLYPGHSVEVAFSLCSRAVGVADQALAVAVHWIAPVDQIVGPLQEVEIRPVVRRDQVPGRVMGAGNQEQGVARLGVEVGPIEGDLEEGQVALFRRRPGR